jgi:uncharacterized protein (TIGR03435 family)
MTFAGLADLMTIVTGQPVPVVDLTGVEGRHQVVLDISYLRIQNASPIRLGRFPGVLSTFIANVQFGLGRDQEADWFDAVNAALKKEGLQLESRKTPVETIVIDHLEKTPTEN